MDDPESHLGWQWVGHFPFNIGVELPLSLLFFLLVQNQINCFYGVFQGKLIQDEAGQVIIEPFFLLGQFGIKTLFIKSKGIETQAHPGKLSEKIFLYLKCGVSAFQLPY